MDDEILDNTDPGLDLDAAAGDGAAADVAGHDDPTAAGLWPASAGQAAAGTQDAAAAAAATDADAAQDAATPARPADAGQRPAWADDPEYQQWEKVKGLVPLLDPLLQQYGSPEAIAQAAEEFQRQQAAAIEQQQEQQRQHAIQQRVAQEIQSGYLAQEQAAERIHILTALDRAARLEMKDALAEIRTSAPLAPPEMIGKWAGQDPNVARQLAADVHQAVQAKQAEIDSLKAQHAKDLENARKQAVTEHLAAQAKQPAAPESGRGQAPAPKGAAPGPRPSLSQLFGWGS